MSCALSSALSQRDNTNDTVNEMSLSPTDHIRA